ncbi:MAG: hypothetical protein R6V47_06590 [Candidatus Delongbacteria bacterium]
MFYDIIIHPSRIELVHRFLSSNKNEMEEKRLSYVDTDFKFDVNTIENGENYEAVKKIIADMITPHIEELNTINIILPSSFTQNKEIVSSASDKDFSEYIAWEAFKMVTDVPGHYKYGHIYSEKEGKIIISVVRNSVERYFSDLLHDLYSNKIDHKLFSLYGSDDHKKLIELDQELKDPLAPFTDPEKDTYAPVSLDDKASNRKSKSPVFILIIVILSAAALYYFNSVKDDPETSSVSSTEEKGSKGFEHSETQITSSEDKDIIKDEDGSDDKSEYIAENDSILPSDTLSADTLSTEISEITEDIDNAEEETEPDIDPEPDESEPQQIPKKTEITAPSLWELIVSLAKMNNDSVVYKDGSVKVYLNGNSDVEKIRSVDPTGSYVFNHSDDILSIEHDSFNFSRYSSQKNFNNFIDIRNDHYIFSPDNDYKIESIDVFESLFKGFEERKVEFKSFTISRSGSEINFTVSFD